LAHGYFGENVMKIEELQQKLAEIKVDAYLINHGNMFIKQDILDEENKLLELTGFSGSNGILLVMKEKSVLLVDGRYEIQSKQEVKNKNIEIYCTGLYPTSKILAPFVCGKINSLMYNPWCFTQKTLKYMQDAFFGIELIADENNLLGGLVSEKKANVFEHKIEFAGKSAAEKINLITEKMKECGLDYYLLCDTASVSWLLNLRSDILPNTPVLRAFALIVKDGSYELFAHNLVGIKYTEMNSLPEKLAALGDVKVGIDRQNTPQKISNILKHNFNMANPIIEAKSIKSEKEMRGFENAHIRDGVALCKFLCWFDKCGQGKTELDICEKLHELRREQKYFYSNSFDTIAAYGSNAAIVHYSPSAKTNKTIENGSVLLLDSGAQYFDGTTDVTRTIAAGDNIDEQIINDFTLVLKAHLALAATIFPINTPDKNFDNIARRELWRYGLEYRHGTGHGVGHFSDVHEMPPSMSSSGSGLLRENMVLSIEPGVYKEGLYGIRIENLVKTVLLKEAPFDGRFIKFEPLTMAPIDKRLINKYLLSTDEQNLFNSYHKKVYETLEKYMSKEEKDWLKEACSSL